ncbi:MAG: cyclic nucleotide-binding domain-containing protein [Pseudobdellovibrionaceae bacterium]
MSVKTFKKGEAIYKDGEKVTAVYLIQSGGANQCLLRGKKTIDLFQLGSSHILGEQVILGQNTHTTSAVATTETKVLEIPIETLRQQYESAPQMLKVIIKSLADRLRLAINDVRSSKLEKDSSPCPEDQVAKVFGSLFHTANHKGDKSQPGRITVEWSLMKQYSQRVFGESPKRLEQAANIFVKLKLAGFETGKNPDNPEGPDEIQKVHFFDLAVVENFFEFYQYYYFKAGRSELLKVEEFSQQMLCGLLKLSEKEQPDRFGIVGVDFGKFSEYCKEELGINLNNDHFNRLENKGVLLKRKNGSAGVVLQFELKEFRSLFQSWKILREIEKWNEKGFVDMDEKEDKPKKKNAGGPACPSCSAELQAAAKFCHECGHKLVTAA